MTKEAPKNNPIIPTPEEKAKLDGQKAKEVAVIEKGKAERTTLQEETAQEKTEKISIELSQVALIGDSIGRGIEEQGFAKLEIGKGRKIVPKGGEMVSQIGRELSKVDPTKTPYLIIQGGTNNLNSPKGGWNPENTAEELMKLYRLAIQKGFKKENITLITIPPHKNTTHLPYGDLVTQCNEFLKKKAGENGFRIFDLHSACVETMKDPDPKKRFALQDGIHPNPQGYRVIANILTYERTGMKNDSTTTTTATTTVETSEIQKENPAKEMHKKYLKTTEQINETDAKTDEEFIKKASIKDLRKKSRLLNAKPATEEKPIEQIVNLKDETARRLRAYTNTRDNEWYKLDYEKFGADTTGSSHEMNIGLGDILLDNDIKEVLITKANGETVKGHKQILTSKNRVGFADENGQYIATHTGDKFRILSDKEVDIKNEKEVATYIKDLKEQDATREMAEVETTRNRGGISSIGIESARKIAELTGEIRTKEPNLSDTDVYKKAATLAEEKAKTAESEEEKRQWEITANECGKNAEAIDTFKEFDLNLFKRKIARVESGGAKYNARNDITAKKMNENPNRKRTIPPSQWAFGKYQFLAGTTAMYGVSLNPTNEESIQRFLNDPVKQEEIMDRLTLDNLKKYTKLSESKKRAYAEAGIDVYKILAAMHFGGASGALSAPIEKLVKGSDWLGGSQKAYWAQMDEIQPITKTPQITPQPSINAPSSLIATQDNTAEGKKIESTIKPGQDIWYVGSSSSVILGNLNKDPSIGTFGVGGAGPQEVLGAVRKLLGTTDKKSLPKRVVLVGMCVNGLSTNGSIDGTVEKNLRTYKQIAELFEKENVEVKISPAPLYGPKKQQIAAFNKALKDSQEYSRYYINTGAEQYASMHLPTEGYRKMIQAEKASRINPENTSAMA